jgi:hypothetical protein
MRLMADHSWSAMLRAMQIDAAPNHLVQGLFGLLINEGALVGQLLRFAAKPNCALRGGFPSCLFCHDAQALLSIV